MATRKNKTTGAAPPAGAKARKPARRPVLGNDPFVRGAAVRAPEPGAPPRNGVSDEPAAFPPAVAPAEPRPPSEAPAEAAPAAEEGFSKELIERASGVARYAGEVRHLVAALWPQLRARLGSLTSLRHIFETPGEVDDFGMDPVLVDRAMPLLDFLYSAWWRVAVHNVEAVPSAGRCVVVANHGGALPWDALVLRLALWRDHPAHRELRPLIEDFVYHMAFVGTVATRLGAVRANPENAERLLSENKVIAVFPEGSRGTAKRWGERYKLQRFGRGGFVKIALRTGAPIVPCAILGSEEAMPAIARGGWLSEKLGLPSAASAAPAPALGPLGFVPLPSKWTVRFGDPIDTREIGPAAAADPLAVNELTERVRAEIQRMLDEGLAARTSAFV